MVSIRKALARVVDGPLARAGFIHSETASRPGSKLWTYERPSGGRWPHAVVFQLSQVSDRTFYLRVRDSSWRVMDAGCLFDEPVVPPKWKFTDQEDLERILEYLVGLVVRVGPRWLEWENPPPEPFDVDKALPAAFATLEAKGFEPKGFWARQRVWPYVWRPAEGCGLVVRRSWEQARALQVYCEVSSVGQHPLVVNAEKWLEFEPSQEDLTRCLERLARAVLEQGLPWLERFRKPEG